MNLWMSDVPFTDELKRQVEFAYGQMRDGHGPRALQTLIRYRGSVLAELFRALAALETLRAQRRATKTQLAKLRAGRRKPNKPEKARQSNNLGF